MMNKESFEIRRERDSLQAGLNALAEKNDLNQKKIAEWDKNKSSLEELKTLKGQLSENLSVIDQVNREMQEALAIIDANK